MGEGRSRIIPAGNYLNYSGFSERGNFIGGGDLILYLVVLLVAVSCSWQWIYSRWMTFGTDAWAIKTLMSDTLHFLILGASIIPNLQMRNLGHREGKD